MFDFKPIILVAGILLTTLGCVMLLPAILDVLLGSADWLTFAFSAGVTLFCGIGLVLATWGRAESLSVKQAFVLTVVSWLALVTFAALPFWLGELQLSFTDAFFESMSGLTTTGATVITQLDRTAPGQLLWRGLLQWIGGIGIIVMSIAVLPMLQVGGMQLFRMESSDTSEKILPRATQIAGSLALLYAGLSALCAIAYFFAGMRMFDAVIHSMTTIATGGFLNTRPVDRLLRFTGDRHGGVGVHASGQPALRALPHRTPGQCRSAVPGFPGTLFPLGGHCSDPRGLGVSGINRCEPDGSRAAVRDLQCHFDGDWNRICDDRFRVVGRLLAGLLLLHHVSRRLRRIHVLRSQDLPHPGGNRERAGQREPHALSQWRFSCSLQSGAVWKTTSLPL